MAIIEDLQSTMDRHDIPMFSTWDHIFVSLRLVHGSVFKLILLFCQLLHSQCLFVLILYRYYSIITIQYCHIFGDLSNSIVANSWILLSKSNMLLKFTLYFQIVQECCQFVDVADIAAMETVIQRYIYIRAIMWQYNEGLQGREIQTT